MSHLVPGDPAPWFVGQTSARPDYNFSSAAGRYLVLAFVAASQSEPGRAVMAALAAQRSLFDDDKIAFFGITADAQDRARVRDDLPGLRWFYDEDHAIARLYGALDKAGAVVPQWLLIDPALHVLATGPLTALDKLIDILGKLGPPASHAGTPMQAPVLLAPRIFEPDLCQHLIALYEQSGGAESGFMVEKDGKTVLAHDHAHKRRRDYLLEDEQLQAAVRARIQRRLLPDIEKAFQFRVTRLERYLVACYEASSGGFFNAHRDNTTKGTAHRRFALTINLNADYDGGELMFPEYGNRLYKPPVGGAVVFSCSLLHRALPVTRGNRFAFLPFLFDEAAAKLREENLQYLARPEELPGAKT